MSKAVTEVEDDRYGFGNGAIMWHLLIVYSISIGVRALNSRHRSAAVITFPTSVAFNHLLVGDKWKKAGGGGWQKLVA